MTFTLRELFGWSLVLFGAGAFITSLFYEALIWWRSNRSISSHFNSIIRD